MAGTLVVVSLGGELFRPRQERPLGAVLRRQAPILAFLVLLIVGAVYLLGPGESRLGRYGTLDLSAVGTRLFGSEAAQARQAGEAYTRSLALGTLLFPFVLGLATAFAGAAGRLGRSIGIVSLVALASLVLVIGGVTLVTTGAAARGEIRVLRGSAAGLARVCRYRARADVVALGRRQRRTRWLDRRLRPPFPARDSGNFFAAPAGAFWTRVMDFRLRVWERDLLGWTGLAPRGWLLIAAALAALVVALALARVWLRPVQAVLAAAAAVCLVGQAVVLTYSLHQELYGTVEVPGGIATGVRETFVDAALPSGAHAAVVPGLLVGEPGGGAERITFWNAKVDETVALWWDGTPVPAPPGFGVIESVVGPDGVAELRGGLQPFLAAEADDPRVQFATRLVIRSHDSRYALFAHPHRRALWTAQGLQPDTAVLPSTPVRLTARSLSRSDGRAGHDAGAHGSAAAGRVARDRRRTHRRLGSPTSTARSGDFSSGRHPVMPARVVPGPGS